MMGWHNDYGYGWYGGSGVTMALMMLLFWLPLIGLGVWLVTRMTRVDTRSTPPTSVPLPPADSARGILDRRFANGELTAEQYTEMRRILESGGAN